MDGEMRTLRACERTELGLEGFIAIVVLRIIPRPVLSTIGYIMTPSGRIIFFYHGQKPSPQSPNHLVHRRKKSALNTCILILLLQTHPCLYDLGFRVGELFWQTSMPDPSTVV